MSPTPSPHPAPEHVVAFSRGQLSCADAAVVEDHLAWCESCVRLLDAQPDDSFLAALRGAARSPDTTRQDVATPNARTPATTRAGEADADAGATSGSMPAEFVGHPRYRVLDLLGRGGMGEVYRAHEPSIGRDLAVKVLLSRYRTDPDAARRFEAEARVTGRLQHPGVPPVFQVGTLADGSPFLAMKLIQGRTLAAVLADGARPDAAALLAVFEHICQAVGYAHSKGVVHRDLKPGNVMVGAFGEVQVMDWGLAKVQSDAEGPDTPGGSSEEALPDLTRDGAVMGTPAYMAPEQARGEIHVVGRRSDVFGLGAILCEILTGEPPFAGPDAGSTLRLAAAGDLAAAFVRLDRCGADPAVAALCRHCLAPDTADRPTDGGEVAHAVAELRAAAAERTRVAELERVRVVAEAAAARKRRRVQLALAAALGLLCIGALAAAWYSDREATTRETESRHREDKNADGLDAVLTACETALRAGDVARAASTLGDAERRSGEPGGERHAGLLARCRADLATLRDLRDFDQFLWTDRQSRPPTGREIVERVRALLVRFGTDPASGSPAGAARRVNESAVRQHVLRALDRWLFSEWGLPDRTPWVRDLLRITDPDPFRDSVRDVLISGDETQFRKLVALAARPEAEEQPARFLPVLADCGVVPVARCRRLLWLALAREPGDLGLFMALADTYPVEDRAAAGDRARWYQSALAVASWCAPAHQGLGLALRLKGDSVGAEACFRKAVELAPGNSASHSNLGLVLHEKGEFDGALKAHREAVRLKPGDGRTHHNLAMTLMAKGDWPGAIAEYREAARLDPKLLESRSGLGMALAMTGDVGGAEAALRALIADAPDYSQGHNNLGVVLQNKGDFPASVASHREAIRLNPANGKAHQGLGTALLRTNDVPGAAAAFREAARLMPDDGEVRGSLGLVLVSTGDVPGAMTQFREALRINPKDALALSNAGNILRTTGDLPKALAAQEDAVKLAPENPQIRLNLGNVLHAMGDRDGAAAAFREAIRLAPRHAPAHFNLSRVLRENRDFRGALTALRAATAADPRNVLCQYTLGLELQEVGDFAGAQVAFRWAVTLDPKNPEHPFLLGCTLIRTGELGAAAANLRESIRLDPKRPGPHFFLGDALFGAGDSAGAEASFREAIRLDPTPAVGHFALTAVLERNGNFRGAVAECEKALRLEPGLAGARAALPWLTRSRDLLNWLPEIEAGRAAPRGPAEALELAELCRHPGVRRYALAVWLYQERPGPVVVLAAGTTPSRYNPARAAALVAAGKDADLTRVGVEEWGHYTGQAYKWLKEDLANLGMQVGNPATRDAIRRMLEHWKKDRDLAAVRDPEWLAAMPASDRKRWEALWAEVDSLLESRR